MTPNHPSSSALAKLDQGLLDLDPLIEIVREGDESKTFPFTICIIANPSLKSPSQGFYPDPILGNRASYQSSVTYITDCLFGRLPGQSETALSHFDIESAIRVVSICFDSSVKSQDESSLVEEDDRSNLLMPRRDRFGLLLAKCGVRADVAYAVSLSAVRTRASSYLTSDEQSGPGIPVDLNGSTIYHRLYARVPGTTAIHATAQGLTALHEFQHAISSYENGKIVDLYVDNTATAINCGLGRPIPALFSRYAGENHASDRTRNSLGYPDRWKSFHCGLLKPSQPSIMDDFRRCISPIGCENDTITMKFIRDRVLAKLSR